MWKREGPSASPIDAILAIGADNRELSEYWELVKEREDRKEKEKKEELALKSRERELELKLQEAGLTVKAEKCQLGRREVSYLGHVVGNGLRRPSEIKLLAISCYRMPATKTDIRAFLGFVGYYRQYILQYSELASPLTDALRKTEPERTRWDSAMKNSFESLRKALMSEHPYEKFVRVAEKGAYEQAGAKISRLF